MSELFLVDGPQDVRIGYEQLQRDVAAMECLPSVVAFETCYGLFKTLRAAIERGGKLVLVDDESGRAEAESLLQLQTPHPQPLSPEYRGEGSQESGAMSRSSEYRGECRIGLFTSGTTGKPKLVLHALDSLTRAVRVSEKHRHDVWGLAYHPAHFAGLQVFFQALANRNPIVRLFGLTPEQMHLAIESERITHLSATPTLMRVLVSDQQTHASVKSVTLGGERTDAELLSKLATMFPNAKFRNVYASTEVGSVLTGEGETFCVPTAYQGLIKIVDGELVIHRSLLAASMRVSMQDDFFLTGDCVEVDQADPLSFRFVARRTDLINVGGFKVNPHEVETHLLNMPEVREAAVYGKANSVTGNLVCCDLVLQQDQTLTAREIFARLKSTLPVYKIPRVVQLVPSLRLTSTGKRQRGA